MPEGDDLVERARAYARGKHAGQRYGAEPYAAHLAAVEDRLRCFGYGDPEVLASAWLHDVVEDTESTEEEIARLFGERVAAIVGAVTDEPGRNRRERHARTYPKIRALPEATALKLADRIANVEESLATD